MEEENEKRTPAACLGRANFMPIHSGIGGDKERHCSRAEALARHHRNTPRTPACHSHKSEDVEAYVSLSSDKASHRIESQQSGQLSWKVIASGTKQSLASVRIVSSLTLLAMTALPKLNTIEPKSRFVGCVVACIMLF